MSIPGFRGFLQENGYSEPDLTHEDWTSADPKFLILFQSFCKEIDELNRRSREEDFSARAQQIFDYRLQTMRREAEQQLAYMGMSMAEIAQMPDRLTDPDLHRPDPVQWSFPDMVNQPTLLRVYEELREHQKLLKSYFGQQEIQDYKNDLETFYTCLIAEVSAGNATQYTLVHGLNQIMLEIALLDQNTAFHTSHGKKVRAELRGLIAEYLSKAYRFGIPPLPAPSSYPPFD